jgi:hypothetical protein
MRDEKNPIALPFFMPPPSSFIPLKRFAPV